MLVAIELDNLYMNKERINSIVQPPSEYELRREKFIERYIGDSFGRECITSFVADIVSLLKKEPDRDIKLFLIDGLDEVTIINEFRFKMMNDEDGYSLEDIGLISNVCDYLTDENADEGQYGEEVITLAKVLVQSIRKLRDGVIDELRGVVDSEKLLVVDEYFKDSNKEDSYSPDKIIGARDLNNRDTIIKTFREKHKSVFLQPYLDAVQEYMTMKPSEYVVKVLAVDSDTGKTVQERVPLITIREILSGKKSWMTEDIKPEFILRALTDVVRGADHLSGSGFVLQDINLNNMGISLRSGRGFLFDLEGLAKKGTVINGRLADKRYFAPELKRGETDYEYKTPIRETEMFYQFGISLGLLRRSKGIILNEATKTILESLESRLIEEDPEKRISLSELIERLEVLYNSL